jgi:hypothetical protein
MQEVPDISFLQNLNQSLVSRFYFIERDALMDHFCW